MKITDKAVATLSTNLAEALNDLRKIKALANAGCPIDNFVLSHLDKIYELHQTMVNKNEDTNVSYIQQLVFHTVQISTYSNNCIIIDRDSVMNVEYFVTDLVNEIISRTNKRTVLDKIFGLNRPNAFSKKLLSRIIRNSLTNSGDLFKENSTSYPDGVVAFNLAELELILQHILNQQENGKHANFNQ